MLADAATVADGKLYVHGGQWDTIGTNALPLRHSAMSIVLVVEVPYNEAHKPHHIEILLELDGEVADTPRIMISNVRPGHPPVSSPGAPVFVSLAIPIHNLELHEAGRYDWLVKIDDELAERIPMALLVLPQPLAPS